MGFLANRSLKNNIFTNVDFSIATPINHKIVFQPTLTLFFFFFLQARATFDILILIGNMKTYYFIKKF